MRTAKANPKLQRLVDLFNRLLIFLFGYYEITDGHTKSTYRESRLHLDWQNLVEDPKGNPRGWPWHGRAWLYWRRPKKTITFNWSWNFWSTFCMAGVSLEQDESAIVFKFGIPPIALWFSIRGVLSHEWMHKKFKYEDREIDFTIHNWAFWWSIWRDDNSWSSKDSKWKRGCFHFDDFLLGKRKHSSVVLAIHEVGIPMREGNYPATITLSEDTWSRSRWFPLRLRKADIKMKIPIPHPGKGENSWDCGDDATYGLSTTARNVEEAIAAMVRTVLNSRRRYGSGVNMEYPAPGKAA